MQTWNTDLCERHCKASLHIEKTVLQGIHLFIVSKQVAGEEAAETETS